MVENSSFSPVLFLLGTLEAGGSETKFVALANRMAARGIPVHVAYLSPPETLLSRLDGVNVIKLHRKGKWSPRAFKNLLNYVSTFGISTVVAANFYPVSYALPLVYFQRKPSPNIIASINTTEILSNRMRRFMRLYIPLLKRCDQIIFGSKRQQHEWLNTYKLPAERSRVIYNGVDEKVFDRSVVPAASDDMRTSLAIPADSGVIVCVGRLRPEKAHRNLLQAVAALEQKYDLEPHVVLVGEGKERAALVDLSQELAIANRIHLVGMADDVRPYLKAADVFALTSLTETFSNASLEASAMGLPVVTSDVGGAREMFPPGSGGTLYPRDDIDELAAALAKNLREVASGKLRKDDIRESVLRNFSIAAMDSAWIDAIWQK